MFGGASTCLPFLKSQVNWDILDYKNWLFISSWFKRCLESGLGSPLCKFTALIVYGREGAMLQMAIELGQTLWVNPELQKVMNLGTWFLTFQPPPLLNKSHRHQHYHHHYHHPHICSFSNSGPCTSCYKDCWHFVWLPCQNSVGKAGHCEQCWGKSLSYKFLLLPMTDDTWDGWWYFHWLMVLPMDDGWWMIFDLHETETA